MSRPTDAERTRPHYVYRCYDAEDRLLYIGCTESVPGRIYHLTALCNMGKHPNGYLRRHMTRWESVEYPDCVTARQAEREAIAAEEPLLNIQHQLAPRSPISPNLIPMRPDVA